MSQVEQSGSIDPGWVTSRYIRRVFRCASLAPRLVEAIVEDHAVPVDFERLRQRLPLDWSKQKRYVGVARLVATRGE